MPDNLGAAWKMFAHDDNGMLTNVGSRWYVKAHGLGCPIVAVLVEQVPTDDESGTHWAWLDSDETSPSMIWPFREALEMCFPYGSKAEVDHGRGIVVRLRLSVIEDEASQPET